MSDVAVIILTYNEERHIERCIRSARQISSAIYVVDSFSKDRTVELATKMGVTVLQNRFVNYAKQFQWALDNVPAEAAWQMRLDADEVIEPDLAAEINAKLPMLGADVTGISLKRKHIFLGRWIRHGGRYPLVLLRLWRRGRGRIEDRWMDEHMVVDGGTTVVFDGGFADHNLNDLTFFTDKHNKYATREAIDVLIRKYDLLSRDDALLQHSSTRQAQVKRFVKERVYNQLPYQLSTLGYFLYRYFIQLGFLDGGPGLAYHFLQGYWYRFLVGAKIEELENEIVALDGKAAKLARISALTGHNLVPAEA
ncbi:glycosyltransferase family 2 protein [Kaistia soli]|uniref:glycosyltransferase family 2 protein n=1 Tax=Kaistia soli TaxID=446684 RepID=UPI0009333A90|nr:glycosyltransferase family 2 protein [Kaistia soli]